MQTITSKLRRFNRRLLPTPLIVLNQLGIIPGKPNPRGYWQFRCPFHKNGKELHPSFNLHRIEGHYRCHTCGAKGGDILHFYRHITGKTFVEACIALSICEDKRL